MRAQVAAIVATEDSCNASKYPREDNTWEEEGGQQVSCLIDTHPGAIIFTVLVLCLDVLTTLQVLHTTMS